MKQTTIANYISKPKPNNKHKTKQQNNTTEIHNHKFQIQRQQIT